MKRHCRIQFRIYLFRQLQVWGIAALKDILWDELNKEGNKIEGIIHRSKDVAKLQAELIWEMGEDEDFEFSYEEEEEEEEELYEDEEEDKE